MERFLIIRFSSIGDIVLTTPVIRCIANRFPEAEIHYLTKLRYKPLLEANPYITGIWTISNNLSEVMPSLKKIPFTRIIDLHKNLRSAIVKTTLNVHSVSFDKLNIQKWLKVKFKIDFLPKRHIVDRFFAGVSKMDVHNDDEGLDFFLPETTMLPGGILPEGFQNGYVVWVIGAKHGTKIFPHGEVIEVCKKTKVPVVLAGGPEDAENGKRIAEASGSHVINACGLLDLQQSALLIKSARKVVTNDTGMMHIAAAFKKDILSIWGSTIPEFGMYPYLAGGNSKMVQVNGLSCRPCSKLGFSKCPKGHFRCMNDIEENEIAFFIREQPV